MCWTPMISRSTAAAISRVSASAFCSSWRRSDAAELLVTHQVIISVGAIMARTTATT